MWLLFSLQTLSCVQIPIWIQARGVSDTSLPHLPTALFAFYHQRGKRKDLYSIDLIIHASFPLLLWLLKQWNSVNQTSLPLGESLRGYSWLSPLLPNGKHKRIAHRSRLFVAHSSWPFPTKHSFQRQSSAGRPSRATRMCSKGQSPMYVCWIFPRGAEYLHLWRRISYKHKRVLYSSVCYR